MTSSGSFVSEDELCHYGVLGMKWGVRHNPVKAYERASKKMTKLNAKTEKLKQNIEKKLTCILLILVFQLRIELLRKQLEVMLKQFHGRKPWKKNSRLQDYLS